MEEAMAARYWCHMCSQMVNPIMEAEIKCPFCQSGFVEEMSSGNGGGLRDVHDPDPDFGTDRALSLWAPILLGMMSSPRRRRRFRRIEFGDEHGGGGGDDDDDDVLNVVDDDGGGNDGYHNHHHLLRRHGGEIDLDREFVSLLRRRRRSSATILQLLQGIRAGIASEYESNENTGDRERERVIMINPFNQSFIVQGSSMNSNQTHNQTPLASLGDYFVGPGLDLLLQHLAENDPNRHGTPPAQKEAIEALPTVKIYEHLQCSVCLDDFEKGTEAKEMPCKHRFHNQCLLPWLELHSSCPVCRYELPADETKVDSERPRIRTTEENGSNNNNNNGENVEGEDDGRNGSSRRFSFPWPFSGLFSSSSPSSSSSSSSSSSGSAFQPGENNPYSGSYGRRGQN